MGHLGSIPELGGSPGEGKGYPFQYSVLENSMESMGLQRAGHNWVPFTFTLLPIRWKLWCKSYTQDDTSLSLLHSHNSFPIENLFCCWIISYHTRCGSEEHTFIISQFLWMWNLCSVLSLSQDYSWSQLGFMVIQKLDWERTHIQAHLGCGQNSPPCFCRACGSLLRHSQQESESYMLGALVFGIT